MKCDLALRHLEICKTRENSAFAKFVRIYPRASLVYSSTSFSSLLTTGRPKYVSLQAFSPHIPCHTYDLPYEAICVSCLATGHKNYSAVTRQFAALKPFFLFTGVVQVGKLRVQGAMPKSAPRTCFHVIYYYPHIVPM